MNIWRNISDIGIKSNQPFEIVRRVRITNQLAFMVSIITIAYFIIDLSFFEKRTDEQIKYLFYIHHIILSLVMFPVFWLNSLQQYGASSIILILTVASINLLSGLILSEPYRIEFYFMGLAASLFVLFSNQRIIILLFAFMVLLFGIYVFNVHNTFPEFFQFNVGLIIRILLAFIFLFAVLYLLMKEGNKNQKTMEMKARLLETERNEVLRANFTKDRVLSVISHDLRGPINSLKGLLKLLSNQQLSQSEFQNYAQKLNQQVNQLQISLEELLSWSRSQSSNLKPQPELIDIDELILFTTNTVRSQADEKNILFETTSHASHIYADQGMIRSVLTNLLTNAIKFTPQNGKISITSHTKESNTTTITVSDSGVGIPEDNLTKIFEGTFSTLGTNNEKGTGIGLSLCQDFIKKNKGKLVVESQSNVGTSFSFTLPSAQPERLAL